MPPNKDQLELSPQEIEEVKSRAKRFRAALPNEVRKYFDKHEPGEISDRRTAEIERFFLKRILLVVILMIDSKLQAKIQTHIMLDMIDNLKIDYQDVTEETIDQLIASVTAYINDHPPTE